jgi:hypothetical protein
MATKAKIPKPIIEYGNTLEYPFVYAQLIAITVSIYKSRLRAIKKGFNAGKAVKIPRHPRTLISQAFNTAVSRNNYDQKFLMDYGVPSLAGLKRSIAMVAKDVDVVFHYPERDKNKKRRTPLEKKTFLGPMLYGIAIGDYVDCDYESLRDAINEKKKKGSKNHSCPVDTSQLKKDLKKLRKAMTTVFACDTAFGQCNNTSMASGHCMLASLIVQDMFGGHIKGGTVGGIPHYWNSICHYDVDTTGDQFGNPAIQVKKKKLYANGYKFDRDPFETMNQDFNEEVWRKHCTFRKRVQKELRQIDKGLAEKLEKATTKLSR